MERHRCKLCYRRFANGRALGGHMRSHMLNLPIPTKAEPRASFETKLHLNSSPSTSSGSEESEPEEGEIIVKGKLLCKLRDNNPKKNTKFEDPEVYEVDGSSSQSITLQDRESETESSKNNVTRRRSKRTRKPAVSLRQHHLQVQDQTLYSDDFCYNDNEHGGGGSSISEVTSEEDVAFCLMMMSRDKWDGNKYGYGYRNQKIKEFGNNVDFSYQEVAPNTNQRKKYKCDTCNKVFRSYQALGGHRASHKKLRVTGRESATINDDNDNNEVTVLEEEKKIHECPVCFRVFASGQALGGHKRSHVTGSSVIEHDTVQSEVVQSPPNRIITDNLLDLNLPAPVDEDEEISHFALSAVSGAVHL